MDRKLAEPAQTIPAPAAAHAPGMPGGGFGGAGVPGRAGGAAGADGVAKNENRFFAGIQPLERLEAGGQAVEVEMLKDLELRRGVASAATSDKLGTSFRYLIEQPVNLPRQKSALL